MIFWFSEFWRKTWKFGDNFDLIGLAIIFAEEPRFDRSPVLIDKINMSPKQYHTFHNPLAKFQ